MHPCCVSMRGLIPQRSAPSAGLVYSAIHHKNGSIHRPKSSQCFYQKTNALRSVRLKSYIFLSVPGRHCKGGRFQRKSALRSVPKCRSASRIRERFDSAGTHSLIPMLRSSPESQIAPSRSVLGRHGKKGRST